MASTAPEPHLLDADLRRRAQQALLLIHEANRLAPRQSPTATARARSYRGMPGTTAVVTFPATATAAAAPRVSYAHSSATFLGSAVSKNEAMETSATLPQFDKTTAAVTGLTTSSSSGGKTVAAGTNEASTSALADGLTESFTDNQEDNHDGTTPPGCSFDRTARAAHFAASASVTFPDPQATRADVGQPIHPTFDLATPAGARAFKMQLDTAVRRDRESRRRQIRERERAASHDQRARAAAAAKVAAESPQARRAAALAAASPNSTRRGLDATIAPLTQAKESLPRALTDDAVPQGGREHRPSCVAQLSPIVLLANSAATDGSEPLSTPTHHYRSEYRHHERPASISTRVAAAALTALAHAVPATAATGGTPRAGDRTACALVESAVAAHPLVSASRAEAAFDALVDKTLHGPGAVDATTVGALIPRPPNATSSCPTVVLGGAVVTAAPVATAAASVAAALATLAQRDASSTRRPPVLAATGDGSTTPSQRQRQRQVAAARRELNVLKGDALQAAAAAAAEVTDSIGFLPTLSPRTARYQRALLESQSVPTGPEAKVALKGPNATLHAATMQGVVAPPLLADLPTSRVRRVRDPPHAPVSGSTDAAEVAMPSPPAQPRLHAAAPQPSQPRTVRPNEVARAKLELLRHDGAARADFDAHCDRLGAMRLRERTAEADRRQAAKVHRRFQQQMERELHERVEERLARAHSNGPSSRMREPHCHASHWSMADAAAEVAVECSNPTAITSSISVMDAREAAHVPLQALLPLRWLAVVVLAARAAHFARALAAGTASLRASTFFDVRQAARAEEAARAAGWRAAGIHAAPHELLSSVSDMDVAGACNGADSATAHRRARFGAAPVVLPNHVGLHQHIFGMDPPNVWTSRGGASRDGGSFVQYPSARKCDGGPTPPATPGSVLGGRRRPLTERRRQILLPTPLPLRRSAEKVAAAVAWLRPEQHSRSELAHMMAAVAVLDRAFVRFAITRRILKRRRAAEHLTQFLRGRMLLTQACRSAVAYRAQVVCCQRIVRRWLAVHRHGLILLRKQWAAVEHTLDPFVARPVATPAGSARDANASDTGSVSELGELGTAAATARWFSRAASARATAATAADRYFDQQQQRVGRNAEVIAYALQAASPLLAVASGVATDDAASASGASASGGGYGSASNNSSSTAAPAAAARAALNTHTKKRALAMARQLPMDFEVVCVLRPGLRELITASVTRAASPLGGGSPKMFSCTPLRPTTADVTIPVARGSRVASASSARLLSLAAAASDVTLRTAAAINNVIVGPYANCGAWSAGHVAASVDEYTARRRSEEMYEEDGMLRAEHANAEDLGGVAFSLPRRDVLRFAFKFSARVFPTDEQRSIAADRAASATPAADSNHATPSALNHWLTGGAQPTAGSALFCVRPTSADDDPSGLGFLQAASQGRGNEGRADSWPESRRPQLNAARECIIAELLDELWRRWRHRYVLDTRTAAAQHRGLDVNFVAPYQRRVASSDELGNVVRRVDSAMAVVVRRVEEIQLDAAQSVPSALLWSVLSDFGVKPPLEMRVLRQRNTPAMAGALTTSVETVGYFPSPPSKAELIPSLPTPVSSPRGRADQAVTFAPRVRGLSVSRQWVRATRASLSLQLQQDFLGSATSSLSGAASPRLPPSAVHAGRLPTAEDGAHQQQGRREIQATMRTGTQTHVGTALLMNVDALVAAAAAMASPSPAALRQRAWPHVGQGGRAKVAGNAIDSREPVAVYVRSKARIAGPIPLLF